MTGLATAVSVKHADTSSTASPSTPSLGTDHVLTNGVAGVLQVMVNGAAA